MRGQRREGRIPSVEPELRSGCQIDVTFYPQILAKSRKKEVGYHRRSLAETAMYRMKCCFGDKLKNRELENQRTESRLRSKILNRFTHLGLPQFEWS